MSTNLHIRLTLSLECLKINKYYIIFEIPTSKFDKNQIALCDTQDIIKKNKHERDFVL